MSSGIPIETRKELYAKQHGRCFWCAEPMLPMDSTETNDPMFPTTDHLIPKAAGGGRGTNLRIACKGCNSLRGTYNTPHWTQTIKDYKNTIARKEKTIEWHRKELGRVTSLLISVMEIPFWKPWKRNKLISLELL